MPRVISSGSADRNATLRRAARRVPVTVPALRTGLHLAQLIGRLLREPTFIVRSWPGLRGTDLLVIAGSKGLEDWF
jgi:hypothetical protein